MPDVVADRINQLSPTQFENLTYECLGALGVENLVWRTPGSDGGRDIEGLSFSKDIANFTTVQRWFIECKRYKSSINWRTIYEKLAYAASNNADILLLSTNSTPSPQCENEITKWNESKKSPIIRVWRGYEIANIVRSVPHVGTMFGLLDDPTIKQSSLIPLASIVSKASDTAYNKAIFLAPDVRSVETVASLSELFSMRLSDMQDYGMPTANPTFTGSRLFPWVDVRCELADWEETPLRAVVAFLGYEFGADRANVTSEDGNLVVHLLDCRQDCAAGLPEQRAIIAFWARLEVTEVAKFSWKVKSLPYAD